MDDIKNTLLSIILSTESKMNINYYDICDDIEKVSEESIYKLACKLLDTSLTYHIFYKYKNEFNKIYNCIKQNYEIIKNQRLKSFDELIFILRDFYNDIMVSVALINKEHYYSNINIFIDEKSYINFLARLYDFGIDIYENGLCPSDFENINYDYDAIAVNDNGLKIIIHKFRKINNNCIAINNGNLVINNKKFHNLFEKKNHIYVLKNEFEYYLVSKTATDSDYLRIFDLKDHVSRIKIRKINETFNLNTKEEKRNGLSKIS